MNDLPDYIDTDENATVTVTDATCADCEHRQVCQLRAGFQQNIQQFAQASGEEPPINADDLAMHCDAYQPEDGDRDGTPAAGGQPGGASDGGDSHPW